MRSLHNLGKISKQFSTIKHEPNKILEKYYKKNELLTGSCNISGTTKYR